MSEPTFSRARRSADGHRHPHDVDGPPVDLTELAFIDSEMDNAILGSGTRYSLEELAGSTGWSVDELQDIWLWAGLPCPDPTLPIYTETEVKGLTDLRRFAENQDLDDEAVRSMLRSIGTSLERLAVWQVESAIWHLARLGNLTDTEARLQAAAMAPEQGMEILEHINNLWLRHYAGAVHRLTTEAILRRGVSDDASFPLMCALGVAQVVDYSERTRDYGVKQYATLVRHFHEKVADIVNVGGGRVIQNTGDMMMFVASSPVGGARIALQIAELTSPDKTGELQVALGWCRVVSFQGDAYGPGVNLVSQLANYAKAGQVLVGPDCSALLARRSDFTLTPVAQVEVQGYGAVTPNSLALA